MHSWAQGEELRGGGATGGGATGGGGDKHSCLIPLWCERYTVDEALCSGRAALLQALAHTFHLEALVFFLVIIVFSSLSQFLPFM